jgi:hypothetical protein
MFVIMLFYEVLVILSFANDGAVSLQFIAEIFTKYDMVFPEVSVFSIILRLLILVLFFSGMMIASFRQIKRRECTLEQFHGKSAGSVAYVTFSFIWVGLVFIWPFTEVFNITLMLVSLAVLAVPTAANILTVSDIRQNNKEVIEKKRAEKAARQALLEIAEAE